MEWIYCIFNLYADNAARGDSAQLCQAKHKHVEHILKLIEEL